MKPQADARVGTGGGTRLIETLGDYGRRKTARGKGGEENILKKDVFKVLKR
jgi:hypothetical protein